VRESIYDCLNLRAWGPAHCPAFTGKHNFFPQVVFSQIFTHSRAVGALQSRSKPGFFISISLITDKKKKKTGEKKKTIRKALPYHAHFIISFPSSREKGKT
jgi:hypothetical protein